MLLSGERAWQDVVSLLFLESSLPIRGSRASKMCLLQLFWWDKTDCSPHLGMDPILEAVSVEYVLPRKNLLNLLFLFYLLLLAANNY